MNASLKHSFRDQKTSNADPELLYKNEHWIAQTRNEAMHSKSKKGFKR